MIIQNMITNQDQNTSSSLDIVQPQNRITFMDSSSSQSFDMSYDKDLDYSKDQSSLSFQIEDQKKFIHKDNIIVDTILSNQPPKRFRKQIFDKYKAPTIIKQQQVKHNVLNIQTENNIMKAFDQIFTSKGTPKSLKNIQFQNKNKKEQENLLVLGKQISMKKIDKKILTSQFITNQPILQSQQKQKKNKQYSSKTNSPQIFKSNQFFKTPLDLSTQKIVENSNNRHQNFNLSQIQYRLSVIEGGDQIDFSRDSTDIADFLNAQIFQQKNSLRITTQNSTKDKIQQKKQIIHIKQALKTQSQQDIAPKINIPISQTTNLNLPNQNLSINNQQNLQQSRFSDVYQRIDMTQSTVNASVVMKNSRFPIFGNNLNFMGNNDTSTMSRMFTKTNSLGFIPIQQQEQTIINSLSSQKIIQQASQDPRVPIFMRKAVKLNSTIPNFLSPTVQSNIDTQNEKLQQIIQNFSQVIYFLNKILQQIRLKQQKRKEILHSFANGITLHKFKNSNWQICMQAQGIQKIKPKQNFIARSWNDMKVQLALQNYQKITQSHRGIKINLKDQRGIKKYWQIREKYNQIQKNLILISNDMYTQMLCLTFPQHYTQFKQILEQQQELFTKAQIHKKQIKLEHYLRLRNKNDELCSSQVGTILIIKLTNQIKFNSAYF